MSQIYVSGPWCFASGVQQVVKSIKAKSKGDKVVYSEKGMLSELIWCINHRVPMFLAYKSADPLDFLNVEQPKSYFY